MLKKSPTESFFQKFFIFFFQADLRPPNHTNISIQPANAIVSGIESASGLMYQQRYQILYRHQSKFVQVSQLFAHIFSSLSLSLHRHLSESFSLSINPGWERRAERLQCPCRPVHPELVLFVSDCCCCRFVDKCKFVFKHIFSSFLQPCFFVTYTVCENFEVWIFFLRIFFVWWICRKNTEFGWEFGLYTKKANLYLLPSGFCRRRTKSQFWI